MKRTDSVKALFFSMIFIAALIASMISPVAKVVDVTGDNQISIEDATMIQKAVVRLFEPSEDFIKLADINEDGVLTVEDATDIQKYLVGIPIGTATEPTTEQPTTVQQTTEQPTTQQPATEPTTVQPTTEQPTTEPTAVVYPTRLSINKESLTLGVGEEYTFIISSDVVEYNFVYSSDNPDVAEISQIGTVKALKPGSAKITCATDNGLTASCIVTVKASPDSLTLNESNVILGVGESFQLHSYIPNNTFAYYIYYSSDNSDVASVSKVGGLITAQSVGTANIQCELKNGLKAVCTVTVRPAPSSVNLNISKTTKKVGESFELSEYTNSGSYANANGLVWSSSNTKVAVVTKGQNNKASVKCMMQGSAKITIKTYNGKTATCNVSVSGSVVKCIDVSEWQDNIDFNKVKQDGYNYVILRAGYGNLTSQKDAKFDQNYNRAKAAGLKVGVYWFSYADSPADAKREADACLYCIRGKSFDLPVYYDMEYEWAIKNLSDNEYTNMAINFCNKIKDAGYKPGVYASASIFCHKLIFDKVKVYSIWNAEWNDKYTVSCDIWQYSDSGRVNGINGNVDMDRIYNLNIVG